jgi:Mrp family chromosome partitioning ATPase
MDADLDRAEKNALARIRRNLASRREAKFTQELLIAEAELEQAKRIEQAQSEESAARTQKMIRLNNLYYDVQNVRLDLERLNRQLSSVEDRVDLMRLDTRAPSYIRVVSPALMPERPIKRPIAGMIAGVFVGALALAFGVPLFLEITNHKVRSPVDLEVLLHNRPLGWILERTPETEGFMRDQIRRIALSLDRERRLYDRTHFVFTSLRPGGGTTRLVLELARELQEIAVRAIVIEANALHPDPRLAAADGHPGMAAVLEGVARIEEAILPGANGRPDIISVGDNQGRKQLSGCRNVRPILDKLVSKYEIVLIDAPPILLSSDAELLASGAHATILVVEAEKTNIGEVNRAIQIMRQVGPPLVQVVVNRVRDYRGLGYYSDLVKEYDSRESSRPG